MFIESRFLFRASTLLALCPGLFAISAAAATGKSAYTLFNPTPRDQLRDLSTDRPDKTESPYTVDAGHFQLEADLASHTRDHDKNGGNDATLNAFTVGALNLKVGLLNDVDLQFLVDSYSRERVRDHAAGTTTTTSGFGDLTARVKINLWGNDGGDTAFGLMPFVKLPTAADGLGNDEVEGGIIFPLAVALPASWGLGYMAEFDYVRDEADSAYAVAVINSVTVSRDLSEKTGAYVELYTERHTGGGAHWIVTGNVGFTYALATDRQLDLGLNLGLTRAAPDLNPFLGFSQRF